MWGKKSKVFYVIFRVYVGPNCCCGV